MKTDLKTLSLAELRERFIEVALLMGYDSDNLSTRSYARRFKQQQSIDDELASRSAIDVLLPDLQHESPWVRYFVAVSCREIAPAETEAALEAIARYPYGTVASHAISSLFILRSGIAVPRRRPRSSP